MNKLSPKPAFSGVIFQKYLEYLDDSEKTTSNERDQKLEKKGDAEDKVSLFFSFRSGLETGLYPRICFFIGTVSNPHCFLSQRTSIKR